MAGRMPGSPAPNPAGSQRRCRKTELLLRGALVATEQLSSPGGSGWERGWPLLPWSEGGAPQDREHRSLWGHGAGCQYLLCDMALVTASISWSFIRFSHWSWSSWSLRISWTDSLWDTGTEPTTGCHKPARPMQAPWKRLGRGVPGAELVWWSVTGHPTDRPHPTFGIHIWGFSTNT